MRTFDAAYKKSKAEQLHQQDVKAANDHALLIESIKSRYGVDDFSKLIPSQKESYKAMINEMWDSRHGLNKKGLAFVNENKEILTKASTEAEIAEFFRKRINIKNCVSLMVAGLPCDNVTKVKKEIESMTGKSFSDAKCKKLIFSMCGELLKESLLAANFNDTLNESEAIDRAGNVLLKAGDKKETTNGYILEIPEKIDAGWCRLFLRSAIKDLCVYDAIATKTASDSKEAVSATEKGIADAIEQLHTALSNIMNL